MASFFRACAEVDEVTALDTLYHRYGSIPQTDYKMIIKLLHKAREEQKRTELYSAWVALLPLMQQGIIKFISFDEYYDRCTGKNVDTRRTEDILKEVSQIRADIRKE